jgi:hypothetical protein
VKILFFLFLLGAILVSPIFGQINFPEISQTELEQSEHTIIYEEYDGFYKLVVINGVTYIVYN